MPEITTDCPFCKEEINARATVCKHCGMDVEPISESRIRGAIQAHQAVVPADRTAVTLAGSNRKKPADTGIAFGLWCVCFLGLAGIHRFYLGKNVTGAIWLLTWGLFGIGQLVDLFRIPSIVQDVNERMHLGRELAATRSFIETNLSDVTTSSRTEKDVVDEIRRLGALRDEGLLSEEEFAAKKRDLLGRL